MDDSSTLRLQSSIMAEMSQEMAYEPDKRKRRAPTWMWVVLVTLSAILLAMTGALAWLLVRYHDDDMTPLPEAGSFSSPFAAIEPTGALTFDEIFQTNFTPRAFYGAWLEGTDQLVYKNDNDDVVLRDPGSQTETVFLSKSFMESNKVSDYYVSPDLSEVLLACESEPIWRYSYRAKYKILIRDSNSLEDFPNFEGLQHKKLRYAKWMSSGFGLIFVYGNNLYYQQSAAATAQQLTHNGDEIYYFNGIPDWLYEEDVLGSRIASYSSPDGRYLCYGSFNDSQLTFVRYSLYGSSDSVYGSLRELAYPISGDVTPDGKPGPNSRAQLHIVDTQNLHAEHVTLEPPSQLADQDHYFTRVSWRDATHVLVTWVNRPQNHAFILMYDVTAPATPTKNYELQEANGWIESPGVLPRWMGPDSYLTILPKKEGATSRDTWKHLAQVTTPSDIEGNVTFLTSGESEVLNVLGYNDTTAVVYYLSTGGDQRDRHLYKVGTSAAEESLQTPTCLSCDLVGCEYVSAYFSASFRYYVLSCLGPDVPTYSIRSTEDHKFVDWLEHNDDFRSRIATKRLPERTFEKVAIGGNYEGWAEVFQPVSGPDAPGPLLIYTYGGPNSQMVTKRYPLGGRQRNWLTYLKTNYGVVVASLDGRGTKGAGDKFLYEMYRKMGTVEVEDQITAASHFVKKDYVNAVKDVAIFGWSYGGQLTSHVIGQDSDVIKCGAAVAPVTTQRMYDTAYTERYMSLATPDDNQAGYNKTDVMPLVENFRNKKYLIAHGTDDDNVHFRHAALLIKALTEAEIPFRTHIFVDENHAIGSIHQSRQLYRDMTEFLVTDCWNVHAAPAPSSAASLSSHLPRITCSSILFTLWMAAIRPLL